MAAITCLHLLLSLRIIYDVLAPSKVVTIIDFSKYLMRVLPVPLFLANRSILLSLSTHFLQQNKMHRVLKNTVSLDVQDSNMWLKRVTHSCYLEGGQRGNQQLGRAQT